MNIRASICLASLLSAAACAAAAPDAVRLSGAQAATSALPTTATADLAGNDGRAVGTVTLAEGPRGVVVRVEGRGLPPGWHGIHFHAKGDCSDPKFERAGGHTHGGEKSVHGLLNPAATDTGDLPNVHVAADGSLKAELFSSFVGFGVEGGRQNLADADGSAVLIHANADDHRSQPIGGAGARIACGVLKPGR
jgi:Cu-Zn family superoxide dismutase